MKFISKMRTLFGLSASVLIACSPHNEAVHHKKANLVPLDPTMNLVVVDNSGPDDPWGKSYGDLNNDGLPDLLVQGNVSGGLVWYENTGNTSTWTKHTIDTGSGFRTDLEVADIDGDGWNDVVSLAPSGLVWYENPQGGSTWTQTVISSVSTHDLEVADLNGDSLIDVVIRDQGAGGNVVTVFTQVSPTSWTPSNLSVISGEGLLVDDVDGDGLKDIITSPVWHQNDGDVSDGYPAHTFAGPQWTEPDVFIAMGDINGDGRRDIVLSPSESGGQFGGRVSWFRAPVNRTEVWPENIVEDNIETVRHFVGVADFNQDGRQDIASAEMTQSSGDDEVIIYKNKATGWEKNLVDVLGSHSMEILDVDNDGDPDLFGANWRDNSQGGETPRDEFVKLWVNETVQPVLAMDQWALHTIDAARPNGAVFIFGGDINGDGYPEVISGDRWYTNPHDLGGTWAINSFASPANNAVAVHDFDGNGTLDVLHSQAVGQGASTAFSWARNDSGTFTVLSNVANSTGGDFLQGVAISDFDQNGQADVALSWHAGGLPVEGLEVPVDPSTTTWPMNSLDSTSQDEALSVGDINGDGHDDLFQGTTWLENDGSGDFSQHTVSTVFPYNSDRNRLADVDGDGDLDAVVGFEGDGTPLVWFECPSDPTQLWPEHTIAASVGGGYSMDVGDLNNDGRPDVVLGEHLGATRLLAFENVSNGTSWNQTVVHAGGSGFDHHDGSRLIDLDDDGDLDIISHGWFNPNQVWVFENLAIDAAGPGNTAPVADAGPDQVLVVPNNTTTLAGTASDDGQPSGTLTTTWSMVSGPGIATFVDVSQLDTDVTFDTEGVYTLRLTVDDGDLTASDDVVIDYGQAPVSSDLVAHWTFDSVSGGTALDSSGNGRHATVNGPTLVPGQVDGALSFDGSSDYVHAGNFDVSGNAITLAMWFYADSFSGNYFDNRFISKSDFGTGEQDHFWMLSGIKINNQPHLRFRLKTDGQTNTLMGNGQDISLGQWHHAAAVYDGSEMRLYLDGVLVGSTSKTGALSVDPTKEINIGRNPDGYGEFDGNIDDVRIYSVALSQAEIVDVMDPGPPNVAPTAIFTATPESGLTPLSVDVDASASADTDGTIISYEWDFGDGTSDTGVTASHVYATAGSYQLDLTVTDDRGATNSFSRTITVTAPNVAPSASFSATPETGNAPLDVALDASASSDSDGTIASYSWDFGDGTTGTGAQTSHTYAAPGTYVVTLTVTDNEGATGTATVTVESVDPPNQLPIAAFTTSSTTVTFDGAASSDADGSVASYSWDFGDGTSGSGTSPSHGFGPGSYSVILTVTDNEGGQSQVSHSLVIP